MPVLSPALRLIAAALVGLWLAATLVGLLAAWRRAIPPQHPAPPDPPEDPRVPASDLPSAAVSLDVFNLSSLPIWWVDRESRLAGANDAYARVAGHPTREGAVCANAELGPAVRALDAEARATDRAVVGEERVTIAGERHLLEVIAIPLRGGEVVHLALDETRRHAAHTLAAVRARDLSDTLDELATGVAWFDESTEIRHHSVPFARMFGLDSRWLDSRPVFERVIDAMRTAGTLPEVADFPGWRAARRSWFAADRSPIEEDWTLPGGALIHVTGKPRDDGLLLMFEDRSEQALLVAARDNLLAVHRATLDHLREGIAVFGPDGRLKLFNRRFAEILVASPEMLGVDFPAERLMEHIAGLLNEPSQARDLRELIVSATAGRTARSGRTTSALGYIVDFAGVPLPDGNALLTFNVIARAAPQPTPEAA